MYPGAGTVVLNRPAQTSYERINFAEHRRPLQDITDLAGVRIITFFPRTVVSVGARIREEFEVLEHTDLSRTLLQEERFGYQSEHYLVRLSSKRTAQPEYNPHLYWPSTIDKGT